MVIHRIVVIIMMLFIMSCSSKRKAEDVRRFFEKGPKFGDSPDVGLYKLSNLRGEWDYVATVHGMSDDMDFCEKIAEALQRQFPNERFSCRLLNH